MYRNVAYFREAIATSKFKPDKLQTAMEFKRRQAGTAEQPKTLRAVQAVLRGDFDTSTFAKFVDALISLAFRAKVCGTGGITQQFAGNVLARLEGSALTVENFWKAITFDKGNRAFPRDATFQAALTSSDLPDRLKTNDFKYFLYATNVTSKRRTCPRIRQSSSKKFCCRNSTPRGKLI